MTKRKNISDYKIKCPNCKEVIAKYRNRILKDDLIYEMVCDDCKKSFKCIKNITVEYITWMDE